MPSSNISNSVSLIDQLLDNWIHFVRRNISDQSLRLQCFYRFTRGLIKVISALLLPAGLGQQSRTSSIHIGAQMDVKVFLDVVKSLISFPVTAESLYYRTKRRLRDEVLKGGLLSPRLVATEVYNHIKQLGLELLDAYLSSMCHHQTRAKMFHSLTKCSRIWIHFLRRNLSDQSLRIRYFHRFTRGLVKVIGAMLPAGLGQQSRTSSILIGAQVDMKVLLDEVESLISFQ
jgi:hypothetical protein